MRKGLDQLKSLTTTSTPPLDGFFLDGEDLVLTSGPRASKYAKDGSPGATFDAKTIGATVVPHRGGWLWAGGYSGGGNGKCFGGRILHRPQGTEVDTPLTQAVCTVATMNVTASSLWFVEDDSRDLADGPAQQTVARLKRLRLP